MNAAVTVQEIREAIEARGLKVKYLATKIGVTAGTLSSYLTGKRGLGLAAKMSLLRELNLDGDAQKHKAS